MKRYSSRKEFIEFTRACIEKKGFCREYMDPYNIQTLQNCRAAIIFSSAVISEIETSNEKLKKVIAQTIKECNAVSSDDSVYVTDEADDLNNAKYLGDAVKKALETAAHVGNLINNNILLFPENLGKIAIKARDFCDAVVKTR